MAPRVTVIVPTRNRASELPGALESVRRQTFSDWECVAVDDGSTDETPEVLARIARSDPRIRVLRRDPGGSIAAARNAALRAARGDLVAFLDDDDRWFPEMLERQTALLDADPDAALVCGRVERCGDRSDVWPRRAPASRPALRALLASNFVPASTVVARRAAVESAGGFDETLPAAEDWDLWIRIALRAPIRADPAVVARYRFDARRFASGEIARLDALEAIVSRLSGAVPRSRLRPALRRLHRFRARRASTLAGKLSEWLRAFA